MSARESYVAARVLDTLLREDYGRLSDRVSRSRDGVGLTLADGRLVRLAPGVMFQDFVVAPGQVLGLEQVLETLAEAAGPEADGERMAAFFEGCVAALAALELHDAHLAQVLAREPSYEALAAFVDHPLDPTSRGRPGLSEAELMAYAPEFAPTFRLRWAAVPRRALTPGSAVRPPTALEGPHDAAGPDEALFPVHPLTVDEVRRIDGVRVLDTPGITVRPTLAMGTVEVGRAGRGPRLHLTLPLPGEPTEPPGDGAGAEDLLRRLATPDVAVAAGREYARAGHDLLAWATSELPEGTMVPVAALALPGVRAELGEVLPAYLRTLLGWQVRLLVEYGVALEAHQRHLAVLPDGGPGGQARLLVRGNGGLLVSPGRLAAAGVEVPDLAGRRMLTDDPHALADVFVTVTLHLAAAPVAFAALPHAEAAALLHDTLAEALARYGGHPMAKLLRARTLDAARLTGPAGVLAPHATSGPNYLKAARRWARTR